MKRVFIFVVEIWTPNGFVVKIMVMAVVVMK
jgi:hypothetical protein